MTEYEWQTSEDPAAMFAVVQAGAPERKLRAFVMACREKVGHDIGKWQEPVRDWKWLAGEWATRDLDDRCPLADRADLLREVFGNPFSGPMSPMGRLRNTIKPGNGYTYEFTAPDLRSWLAWREGTIPKLAASILSPDTAEWTCQRCNYMNAGPICTKCGNVGYNIPPDWSLMPLLADAMEEAGCHVPEILLHLRGQEPCPGGSGLVTDATPHGECIDGKVAGWQSGPDISEKNKTEWTICQQCKGTGIRPDVHVRGCWALDLFAETNVL